MQEPGARKYDVVIIGGGPAGARTASLISRAGYRTLLLEEHECFGSPIQCAGIVSNRLHDLVDIDLPVLNSIRGGTVIPPNGQGLELIAPEIKAVVIDRGDFDRQMGERAIADGSEVLLNARCIDIKTVGTLVHITYRNNIGGEEHTVSSSLVIGADGPRSLVREKMGIDRPKEFLYGMQAEVPSELISDLRDDEVSVYFGKAVAPGFFAWLIPAGDFVRVGLCTSGGEFPKRYLQGFLGSLDISDIRGLEYTSGTIPLGLLETSHADNTMLVGDAACQVKPLTGGGLVFGMICAKHCADTAIASLEENDQSKSFLGRYHELWTAEIGREIRSAILLRKIFLSMSDKDMDSLVKILGEEDLSAFLVSRGDMDFPAAASKVMLRKFPKLIKFAPHLLKAFL